MSTNQKLSTCTLHSAIFTCKYMYCVLYFNILLYKLWACFHCEVTTPRNDNRMTLLVRCRFCERKQVPFLNVEMRDTKSSVTGNRSDRHSLAEDTKTFSCSQNDANRLVNNQVLFLSLQSKSFALIDIDNTKLSSCLKPVSLLVQIQHQHNF